MKKELTLLDLAHIFLIAYIWRNMTDYNYKTAGVMFVIWGVLIILSVRTLIKYGFKELCALEKVLVVLTIIVLLSAVIVYILFALYMRFDYEIVNGLFHVK